MGEGTQGKLLCLVEKLLTKERTQSRLERAREGFQRGRQLGRHPASPFNPSERGNCYDL